MARHRISKVSGSPGAHACESMGLPGFAGSALVSSRIEFGCAEACCTEACFAEGCGAEGCCAEACAAHSNDDFDSMGLPSYQHFRPSIRRQDQYACEFDGIAALHCFACAVGISIDDSVAIQAAKVINGVCFLIQHLTQ
jgi:hypothetical protein